MPPHARNARGFFALAADQITDEGLQWIEVMPVADKARNGPWYFTITPDDLEVYAQSIRDHGGRIPVDYDHEGATDQGSTRAAGWFTGQAEVRDTETGPRLYAEVKWTPKARQEIEDGEYRMISPEFSFQTTDKKTGLMTRAKELLAATLTNRPFFRELAPVGAEVVWRTTDGWQHIQSLIHQALNPGPVETSRYWVIDVAPGKALVEEYQSQKTWVVPYAVDDQGDVTVASAGEWSEAEREWVAAARDALKANTAARRFQPKETDMDTKVLAKTLGLAEDATEEQITAAIKERDDKIADLEDSKSDEKSGVEKLEQDLAAERTRRVVGERDQVLANAVREGRILPAQKDALVKTFGADSPTDEHVSALAEFVNATDEGTFLHKPAGHGQGGDEEPDLTAARDDLTVRRDGVKGRDLTPDDDTLKVDAAAKKLLAERGKTTYTEAEYLDACEQVLATAV